ncbi:hypothetical protein EJ08DRAFT_181043 [Tothia fuscella]|uniref:Azaphilone pigments biosynthesis cluster protein L N-terminal domain-containing protein n=1 Tax=Tothia fuscella TaxID=1048955 RepID=A0A9P4U046_9PEZI|nr:hypothetical protein EJ08DRAFT_181043 [Tothia fuscella]
MADPLSICASVVSLAGAGLKLSTTLYTYSATAFKADKELKDIAENVSVTSSVLDQLGRILEEDKKARLCSDSALKTTEGVASRCKTVFQELDTALQKSLRKSKDGKLSTVQKMKWPFLEPKVRLAQMNLESIKSTLLLMLNVVSYARNVAQDKLSDQSEQRELIASLIETNKETNRRFEDMSNLMKGMDISTISRATTLHSDATSMFSQNGTVAEIEGATEGVSRNAITEAFCRLCQEDCLNSEHQHYRSDDFTTSIKEIRALLVELIQAEEDLKSWKDSKAQKSCSDIRDTFHSAIEILHPIFNKDAQNVSAGMCSHTGFNTRRSRGFHEPMSLQTQPISQAQSIIDSSRLMMKDRAQRQLDIQRQYMWDNVDHPIGVAAAQAGLVQQEQRIQQTQQQLLAPGPIAEGFSQKVYPGAASASSMIPKRTQLQEQHQTHGLSNNQTMALTQRQQMQQIPSTPITSMNAPQLQSMAHRQTMSAQNAPGDEYSDRNNTTAKAGLAGALAGGLARQARSRSRGGRGRSRSESKVRQAAPIIAAGLGSAAVAGLYEKRKAEQEVCRAESIGESRSRSRSRSIPVSGHRGSTSGTALVEYGGEPLYSDSKLVEKESHKVDTHDTEDMSNFGYEMQQNLTDPTYNKPHPTPVSPTVRHISSHSQDPMDDLAFSVDGPIILENFDFDSFLHDTEDVSFGDFDFGEPDENSNLPHSVKRKRKERDNSIDDGSDSTLARAQSPPSPVYSPASSVYSTASPAYLPCSDNETIDDAPPLKFQKTHPGEHVLWDSKVTESNIPLGTPAITTPFNFAPNQQNLKRSYTSENSYSPPGAGYIDAQAAFRQQMLVQQQSQQSQQANMPVPSAAVHSSGSHGSPAPQDYLMQLMLLEQQNKKRLLHARQEQAEFHHLIRSQAGSESDKYVPVASKKSFALQDYQTQLMLLEQQNKKRLLHARQEQAEFHHLIRSQAGSESDKYVPVASKKSFALQDYQTQLMLLEQQNKKRLIHARQEKAEFQHLPNSRVGSESGKYVPVASKESLKDNRAEISAPAKQDIVDPVQALLNKWTNVFDKDIKREQCDVGNQPNKRDWEEFVPHPDFTAVHHEFDFGPGPSRNTFG